MSQSSIPQPAHRATTAEIRVGVVGQGFIGRAHSFALQQARLLEETGLRPIVLCGRDAARAEANAQLWGYERATDDWRAVVEAPDVDLVCVLATNDLHHPIALAALAAGKAVLCEKPLARTLPESQELAEVAARADAALTACSFNYRFMPAIELARRLIAGGELGEITHFRARYLQDTGFSSRHNWHHERERAGTGAIGDYCHVIDLAHHLVGDVARVSAETLVYRSERPDADGVSRPVTVEDAYVGAGSFASGALLSLECSRLSSGRKAQQLVEVAGDRGALWWDMEDLNHLWLHRAADGATAGFRRILVTEPQHPFVAHWWPTGHGLGWEHSLVHQWVGLARALRAGAAPEVPQASFEDGRRADVVVHALAHAAQTRRAVPIAYDAPAGAATQTTPPRQEPMHVLR